MDLFNTIGHIWQIKLLVLITDCFYGRTTAGAL